MIDELVLSMRAEIDRLTAENAKLRAALEETKRYTLSLRQEVFGDDQYAFGVNDTVRQVVVALERAALANEQEPA